MNSVSLLAIAQRCRELMRTARSNVVQEQLRVWAEEFEEQAAILDREPLAADTRPEFAAT
jgi:hypothetical protein